MSKDNSKFLQYPGLPSERCERWLIKYPEDEEEPPRPIGRGRGRGRGQSINDVPKRTPPPPPIISPVEEMLPPRTSPVEEMPQSSTTQAHVKSGLGQGGPSKKVNKASGYIMFLQYTKKVNGVTGYKSINDLIKLFDKDWQELPEEDKAAWKTKAKSQVSSTPTPSASTGSSPAVAAQYRSLYRDIDMENNEDLLY